MLPEGCSSFPNMYIQFEMPLNVQELLCAGCCRKDLQVFNFPVPTDH